MGDVQSAGDELPTAVVLPVLLGGTGVVLLGRGSSSLMLGVVRLGRGGSSVLTDWALGLFWRTGILSFSPSSGHPFAAMVALPSRKATITCPLTLVPIMRAWADGESKGLRGDEEDGQNCRIVAPSGA